MTKKEILTKISTERKTMMNNEVRLLKDLTREIFGEDPGMLVLMLKQDSQTFILLERGDLDPVILLLEDFLQLLIRRKMINKRSSSKKISI